MRKTILLTSLLTLATTLSGSTVLGAGQPEIFKLDPPNWWAGHSINPV